MFPIKNKTDLITLKGIIIPVDWDTKGNAVAIAISTQGEEEYLIWNDTIGKRLFNFIQDSVKVRGEIMDAAGVKLIKINDIQKCALGIPDEINNSIKSSNQQAKSSKRHN